MSVASSGARQAPPPPLTLILHCMIAFRQHTSFSTARATGRFLSLTACLRFPLACTAPSSRLKIGLHPIARTSWACTPVNSELYFFSTSARSRSSPRASPGAHRHMDTCLLGLVLPTHLLSLYGVCCCSLSRDRNGGCLSIVTIMKFRNRRDVDEMKCI